MEQTIHGQTFYHKNLFDKTIPKEKKPDCWYLRLLHGLVVVAISFFIFFAQKWSNGVN